MRKTNDDYLNNLKTELDKGNNLIDYFITIGINEETIFNNFLYENDIETLNSSELIKPEILTKFPPIEKKNVIVDENIIRHCFPNGFNTIESNEIPDKSSFYFVLDNNHSSIEYPQKFMACLVFYEKLESYKKAYKKFQSDIDLRYSSYHIAKNSRVKRDSANLDSSSITEYDVYYNNSNLNNNNPYGINTNDNFNSNLNNNINSQMNNSETENNLNETNKKIIFNNNNNLNSNNFNVNNKIGIHQKKNSLTNRADFSINSDISDNSTNPNNLSTLNNIITPSSLKKSIKNINHNNSSATKSSSLLVPNSSLRNTNFPGLKAINQNPNLNCQSVENTNLSKNNLKENINNNNNNNPNEKNNSALGTLTFNSNINPTSYNYTTNQTLGAESAYTQTNPNPLGNSNSNNARSNSLRSSYSSISTITGVRRKLKNIYIPKCICLVSVHPFCNELLSILEGIYSYVSSNTKLRKPLEKIIENLVIEIPVPPRGLYSINYELFDITLNFKQSKMNELPYISFNLEQIFMHFDIDQTLEIFKHLLLETRMIFFSKEMKILSPIIHGFVTLIYPFKYPFNYITVIPQENFTILENVTPFIIGINQGYSEDFFKVNEIDISEINFLVIDIDNKKVDLHCHLAKNKDEATKKKIIKKEFPNLPEHYKNKLHEKIREYFDQIKSGRKSSCAAMINKTNNNRINQQPYHSIAGQRSNSINNSGLNLNNNNNGFNSGNANQGKESGSNFIKTIRNYFYQFMVSIFLNYSKFLNLDYYNNKFMSISIPSVRNLFRVDEFLSSVSANDRPFYTKFILDTQQFADFIYKRMIPKDSKEKLEILLFDEHITEKNNRKYFSKKTATHFLHSELYDFKSIYYVEKQRAMNDFEKKYFLEYENRKAAIKYGQEILFEKDGDITISYFYFPTLMTNFYFYSNIKNYIIPRNLSEELEQINIEMVSKSHLSVISIKETVMENYIYLCWAQLWAMTFWYHDLEEKRYRFNQLLNVLDRLNQYEIEIFNLLFESINKYGDESMIIELYNKMLFKYKLYPTYSICTIYNRIMDRKNHQKNQYNNQNKSSPSQTNQTVPQQKKPNSLKQTPPNLNPTLISNKPLSSKANELSSRISSISELEIKQVFRLRSIKSKYDESEINDKYLFLDVYPCVECQMPIDLYSICRNFKDMNKDLEWALCGNCQTKILPKLRIKYLNEKKIEAENINNNVFNIRRDSCSSLNSDHYNCDESEVLYSPFHLKYNFYNSSFIENRLKLDIDYFKIKFNAIFWNSIWYFKIKDLPYDFISPYAEQLAERIKLDKLINVESNNLNSNISGNKKGIGVNRLDSIQNLISGKNLFGNSSSSATVSVNKNISVSNSNNVNPTGSGNLVNNTSSGADSNIVKFEEDEIECDIDDKEKELNFKNKVKNFSMKDISNNVTQEDKNKALLTEGNENKENFSSLKTFENLVLLNNSSDNLETELNKANNNSSNKNNQTNNSKILHTNNSNSDLENDSINLNLNSIINNNKIKLNSQLAVNCDEYENLAYKPKDNNQNEINKQKIDITGLDGLLAKNSLEKSKNINNTLKNDYQTNEYGNDDYYRAITNVKEIKTFEIKSKTFLPIEQTSNLSDKSFNYNLNHSNPNASVNFKTESFTNTIKNVNVNYLSDFNSKANVSNISLANNSDINLKRDLLQENPSNILEQLNSAEKKKYSFDFHLNKDNSFKQKTNETPINITPSENVNLTPSNNGSNISVANNNPAYYKYECGFDSNKNLTEKNESNKNLIINNINSKNSNNYFNKTSINCNSNLNRLNLQLNLNDLDKKISEESLILENEEKINISSHKIEDINIKSFDTGKHMYRRSELTLDPMELENLQQMYNFSLTTEEGAFSTKNIGPYSPKEKQTINLTLNLNAEKNQNSNFYKKFINATNNNNFDKNNIQNNSGINNQMQGININSINTPRQTTANTNYKISLSSFKKANEYTSNNQQNVECFAYSQTSRNISHKKNFGNILVNLEKEKLEFDKNFETNIDLESLKRNNLITLNQNSNKELPSIKNINNNQKDKTYINSNIYCNDKANQNVNYTNKTSNQENFVASQIKQANSVKHQINFLQSEIGNQSNPQPIPCDSFNSLNFRSLNSMQKDDKSNNTVENKDCQYSSNSFKYNNINLKSNLDDSKNNNNNFISLNETNDKNFNYFSDKNDNDFLKATDESEPNNPKTRSILLNKDEKNSASNLNNSKKLSFNLPINHINSETNITGYSSLSSREHQSTNDLHTYNFANLSNKIENKNIFMLNNNSNNNNNLSNNLSAPNEFIANSNTNLKYDFKDINNNLSTSKNGGYSTASASYNFNHLYESKQSTDAAAIYNNINNSKTNNNQYNTISNSEIDNNQRLILSKDDLIVNDHNELLSENLFKIKPHHEAKKPSLTRLGTIIEVVEGERDRDRMILSSSCSNININNLKYSETNCISESDSEKLIDFNNNPNSVYCGESSEIDKKMSLKRYSTFNIRDILKDKERLEKINLQSRCHTEGVEDDESPRGIYQNMNNNLSNISSKTDVLSAHSLSAKKNHDFIIDRDKTPIKFSIEGNNDIFNDKFSSIKDFISTSGFNKNPE